MRAWERTEAFEVVDLTRILRGRGGVEAMNANRRKVAADRWSRHRLG
jgi:hypothetical protein